MFGGLFVLALAVRSVHYPLVFTQIGVQLPYAGDAYYHLRRIWFSVARFPESLTFDRYVSFPEGSQIVWPSTFDWMIAASIRPFVDSSDQAAVEAMAVWVPPLLGAVTTGLVGLLAARLYGRGAGWCAGLLYAVLPISFISSRLGMIDHHVAVAMLTTAMLWIACEIFGLDERAPTWTAALRGRMARASVALGLVIASAISTWPGALLHIVVVQVAFGGWWLLAGGREAARARAVAFSVCQSVAALCVAPLAMGVVWREYGAWSPLVLSALQPAYFASAAAMICVAQLLHERTTLGETLGRRAISGFALAGTGLLVAFVAIPGLREAIFFAGSWFTQGVDLLGQINELRPLFMWQGHFDLKFPIVHFGIGIIILPFIGLHLARRALLEASGKHGLLLFWSLVFTALTLQQWRFGNTLGVAYAVLVGAVLAEWLAGIRRRVATRSWRPLLEVVFVAGLIGWTATAFSIFYRPILRSGLAALESAPRRELGPLRPSIRIYDEAGRWLERNTPKTHGYLDASTQPEYGVLGPWAQGHILRYRSERPMVQDNFGPYAGRESFAAAWDYFAEREESVAIGLLQRLGVRYVVAGDAGAGSIEGVGPDSMAIRLAHAFGSVTRDAHGETIPGLSHHRMLFYAHSARPGETHRLRMAPPYTNLGVWEVVPGARIEGSARPGSSIELWLGMETSWQAADTYHRITVTDDRGRYHFVVPYSTDVRFSPDIRVAQAYQVSSPRGRGRIAVREADIRSGDVVVGPDL
jgi:dolichyl-diphosphooligosaccharide--protein glycosyltransferase